MFLYTEHLYILNETDVKGVILHWRGSFLCSISCVLKEFRCYDPVWIGLSCQKDHGGRGCDYENYKQPQLQ